MATYADGKSEPSLGDKVLGEGVKGIVVGVKDDQVLVRSKGLWNPGKPTKLGAEVRKAYAAGELTLILRAPAPEARPARPVIRVA